MLQFIESGDCAWLWVLSDWGRWRKDGRTEGARLIGLSVIGVRIEGRSRGWEGRLYMDLRLNGARIR